MRIRLLTLTFPLALSLCAFAADRAPVENRDPERAGARHFVLDPQHVLSDAERAQLAADGVVVQRALPNGRYIVRVAAGTSVDATDPRVKSLAAFTVTEKLQRSAYRAAARGGAFARLNVLFHDDVSIDDAVAAVEAAGGTTEQPLLLDFGPLRSLKVKLPPASLETLAADERVMSIAAPISHRAVAYNDEAAALSSVDVVQAAPYNLTGKNVTLAFFELAPAQASHVEFGGRLTVHFQCLGTSDSQCQRSDYVQHATHTGGTLIAAGINSQAKGMAPEATLHGYRGADPTDSWLQIKDATLRDLGSVGDSNSWGFTVGWSAEGSTGWTWTEDDELLGGYDESLSAVIDHAAIDNQTLMVYAAGNEAGNSGPASPPFAHNHVDDNGNSTSDVYCYSTNGSGTDCPTTICHTGTAFCETERHPVRSPYGSINWLASEKNVLSIGAVDFQKTIASFSSRGPAKDGRVKPELVARGVSVLSTVPTNSYARSSGTSMSTPVVTGSLALLTQELRILTGNATLRPSPVLLKAVAIAGAEDLGLAGPDATYGYGLFNAKKSVDILIADNNQAKRIKSDSVGQGGQFDYSMTLGSPQDLRFLLTWFDPETVTLSSDPAQPVLLNDLDLKVVGPDGSTTLPYALDPNDPCYLTPANICQPATKKVNTVDNTELVEIKSAAAGTYHVIVSGKRVIAAGPQAFVLVSSEADFGVNAPACTDATEPNDTAATAYGPLTLSTPASARICSASDNDFFKFTSNAVGQVSVTVTSADTPLTVTLSAAGVSVATPVNVPAGSSATVTAASGTASPTQFTVQVSPAGALGATGAYTVKAAFPFSAPARRRTVGH